MATAAIPAIPGLSVKRQIARGGMANVYLAVQEGINRTVAVKLLKPEVARDHSVAQRFLQEGRIMACLHHPGIASVYESGVYNGLYYLVMEYIPDGTLGQLLEQKVSPQRAAEIVKAIASALSHAHGKHYVHRDIKPQNILLRSDGSPVLTDFGVAKDLVNDKDLTRIGTQVGTLCYMSPESIDGQSELDGRSDLFSLGVLLYRMLGGRLPFNGTSVYSLYLQLTETPIPQLPAETARFQPIVERLLARKREDRLATADELIQELDLLETKSSQKTVNGVSVSPDDVGDIASLEPPGGKSGFPWGRLVLIGSMSLAITATLLWAVVPFYDTWRYQKLRGVIAESQLQGDEATRIHQKRVEETEEYFAAMARELATLETTLHEAERQRKESLHTLQQQQRETKAVIEGKRERMEQSIQDQENVIEQERALLQLLESRRSTLETQFLESQQKGQESIERLRSAQAQVRNEIQGAYRRLKEAEMEVEEQLANEKATLDALRQESLVIQQKVEGLSGREDARLVELAAIRLELTGVEERLQAVMGRQEEYGTRSKEMTSLRRALEEHMANDRLISPSGDNAYLTCRQLARLNAVAGDQCVVSIAGRFEERAEQAIAESDLPRALLEIEKGLSLAPDHKRLREQSELVALRIEAERLRVAGSGIRPPGTSAFDIYLQVLRTDADNSLAQLGIVQVLQTHTDSLQRQSLSVSEHRDELGRVLALLEKNLPDGQWHGALSQQHEELKQHFKTLEQEQRSIEALLGEALEHSERGDWHNACAQYANIVARDPYSRSLPVPALVQCPLLDSTVREQARGLIEHVRRITDREEENLEQAVFLLEEVLELVPGHRQACEVIRGLAEFHFTAAANSVSDDVRSAIDHLAKGSRARVSDPRSQGILAQIKTNAGSEFVDAVIVDAYEKQITLQVFDAWELYQLVIVLDPNNSRVRQEISKILRYSLNIPHWRYVFLAEEIVQALLRMGVPYGEMEEALVIIKAFYDRQSQSNEQVQWRLDRLSNFMESKGQSADHSATCVDPRSGSWTSPGVRAGLVLARHNKAQ